MLLHILRLIFDIMQLYYSWVSFRTPSQPRRMRTRSTPFRGTPSANSAKKTALYGRAERTRYDRNLIFSDVCDNIHFSKTVKDDKLMLPHLTAYVLIFCFSYEFVVDNVVLQQGRNNTESLKLYWILEIILNHWNNT